VRAVAPVGIDSTIDPPNPFVALPASACNGHLARAIHDTDDPADDIALSNGFERRAQIERKRSTRTRTPSFARPRQSKPPRRESPNMGMCMSTTSEEQEQKKKSQAIDRQLEEDSRRLRRECKILLLGTSGARLVP
jgi:hypothetical protein